MQVLPSDGPLACLWKAMQGKDWVCMHGILEALRGSHYSESRIRTTVFSAVGTLLHRREDKHAGLDRCRVFYRLIEDVPLPTNERTMPTKKQRLARWNPRRHDRDGGHALDPFRDLKYS